MWQPWVGATFGIGPDGIEQLTLSQYVAMYEWARDTAS